MWILWRLVGRRVLDFLVVLIVRPPKAMLDTFFFVDSFYGKMEAQQAKKEAQEEKRKTQRR
jgi:hypothetical protein